MTKENELEGFGLAPIQREGQPVWEAYGLSAPTDKPKYESVWVEIPVPLGLEKKAYNMIKKLIAKHYPKDWDEQRVGLDEETLK